MVYDQQCGAHRVGQGLEEVSTLLALGASGRQPIQRGLDRRAQRAQSNRDRRPLIALGGQTLDELSQCPIRRPRTSHQVQHRQGEHADQHQGGRIEAALHEEQNRQGQHGDRDGPQGCAQGETRRA